MLVQANSIRIPLADNSVHMVVTSPPYFSLRSYLNPDDPLKPLEIGLEETPQEYVAKMVAVFREVRRVLRPDGVMFINIGDTYGTGTTAGRTPGNRGIGANTQAAQDIVRAGGQAKQLMMIPARLALALQDDGWWLRSEIVWAKSNPMPESVTDRPTKAHEMIYLLAKSPRYYFDAEAVREPLKASTIEREKSGYNAAFASQFRGSPTDKRYLNGKQLDKVSPEAGRNIRSVWEISTEPFSGAHYAVFPTEIPRRCILAGSSARGVCGKCGKAWVRVMERVSKSLPVEQRNGRVGHNGAPPQQSGWFWEGPTTKDTGKWRPTCSCNAPTVPAVILDPFTGSGTTGQVARELGRRFIGLDLNVSYLAFNALPRSENLTASAALGSLPMFAGLETGEGVK